MDRDSYPLVVLVVLAVCLAVGLAWGLSTSTVAFGPYNYDWDGGSELRTTLSENAEVEIGLSTDAYGATPPDETVAFVLGESEHYDAADRRQLRSFLAQGGTLVVASSDATTNDLLADLEVTARIHGQTVRDDRHNYRDAALVRAIGVTDHDLVRDVDALTLNHGTALTPNEAIPLANTSALASLGDEDGLFEADPLASGDPAATDDAEVGDDEAAADETETVGGQDVDDGTGTLDEGDDETGALRPVAAVEQVGDGTVVVVSDESVGTNAMLDQEGNRQFVRNLGTDHEYVLLDYSTGAALPPLTYAVLAVQSSPLLQSLVGLAGLVLVVFWGRLGSVAGRSWNRLVVAAGLAGTPPSRGEFGTQPEWRPDDTAGGASGETPDEEVLTTYVTAQYPDWERERVERVTKAIIRQQRKEGDNE